MTEQEMKSKDIINVELEKNEKIEQAYKEAMQMEIPDLWDRIDAALPKKECSDMLYTTSKHNHQNKKNRLNSFKISKTATLVAACLCAAVVIPFILLVQKNNQRATEMAEDSAMSEKTMAEAAPAAAEEEMPANETNFTQKTETLQESDLARDEATTEKNALPKEENVLYTPDVKVEIQTFDTNYGENQLDGYQIFTIKILEDASGIYEKDSIMNVYVEDNEVTGLKIGEQDTVDLIFPEATSSTIPYIYMSKNK